MSKWLPLQRRRIGDHLNPDTTFFCFFATRPLEWKPYPPTTVCEKEFICSIPSLPPMLSPPPLALSVHICLGHLQLGRSCMALEWLIFSVCCQFGASYMIYVVSACARGIILSFFSQLNPRHFASNLHSCFVLVEFMPCSCYVVNHLA